ncbi:MAG: S8 family peptidase [Bacteroidia bacterium]
MLGVHELHELGFTGKGIRIAVFDDGFTNVDSINGFQHLNVVYQKDLVDNDNDVFGPCEGGCSHGTEVLSVVAARDSLLTGAAPDAEYYLFRVENNQIEVREEENMWAEAARLADSLDVHIIQSSVGYLDFDDGFTYPLEQRDGKTAPSSQAAIQAARNGILVVNGVGNVGTRGIVVPADADSILSVGAVTSQHLVAAFSSRGPTGDGRLKPEVIALGSQVTVLDTNGIIAYRTGTSFSSPLIAGLAACLWQAAEACGVQTDAMFVREAIMFSGHLNSNPGNGYGYGIPDARIAFGYLTNKALGNSGIDFPLSQIIVWPNPSSNEAYLSIKINRPVTSLMIEIFDQTGSKRLWQTREFTQPDVTKIINLPDLDYAGQYFIRVSDKDGLQLASTIWVRR